MVFSDQISNFLKKNFKKCVEKIPQIMFYCIFKSKLYKNFQILEIFHKPRASGEQSPTFGGLRSPKVGPTQPRGKKFGRRLPEIAELQPSTVVYITIPIVLNRHYIKKQLYQKQNSTK